MALKKNFSSGSKYYYAKVGRISYTKMAQPIGIEVFLLVRDSSDSEYEVLENTLGYNPPSGTAPWRIEDISAENQNVVRTAYEWLKGNIDLFNGWEDV